MTTQSNLIMTLSNSIIGVSILAMPFCFQECGIILSLLMLFLTSIVSRLACHFLMKSAVASKTRKFEILARDTFGSAGKTVIELSTVGFLIGSSVAFFVVVGDLGPAIIQSFLNLEMSVQALRPAVLIGVAVFIILPLSLLHNIDSLSSVCTITFGFYIILVIKIILEAAPLMFSYSWVDKVNYWRPAGILQCLPIFSSALSCQTQLFEIFENLLSGPMDKMNGPVDKMNAVIRSSINMCTAVYMSVGLFGYIAYCSQPLTGNILLNLPSSFGGDTIKFGFVCSVAASFPLIVFPCRASLYSFLSHQSYSQSLAKNTAYSTIKMLTILIVTVSLILALLVPSIELVLGLLGSTIGVILCYILPSVFFTKLFKKNTNERVLAQVVIVVGIFIMILGTYTNLFAAEQALSEHEINPIPADLSIKLAPIQPETIEEPKRQVEEPLMIDPVKGKWDQTKLAVDSNVEVRKEPPIPVEPSDSRKIIPEEQKVIDVSKNVADIPSLNLSKIVDNKGVNEKVEIEKLNKEPPNVIKSPLEVKKNEILEPQNKDLNQEPPKSRKLIKSKKIDKLKHMKNPSIKKVDNTIKKKENLNAEILDKLKDSIPLPIALNKNLSMFNVTLDHRLDDIKVIPKTDEKIINRDLLSQKSSQHTLEREKRDLDAISSTVVLQEDVKSLELSNSEIKPKLSAQKTVSSQVNSSDNSKLPKQKIQDPKPDHKQAADEITGDSVKKNIESTRVDSSPHEIGQESKNIILDSKKINAVRPVSLKDEITSSISSDQINKNVNLTSNQEHFSPSDKSPSSENLRIRNEKNIVFDETKENKESIVIKTVNIDKIGKGTLKEALKNSNGLDSEQEKTCDKNNSLKKSNGDSLSISEPDRKIKKDRQADSIPNLNIQAPLHLSNPDNILDSLKSNDIEVREIFRDVVKPLKRELKSVSGFVQTKSIKTIDVNFNSLNNLGNSLKQKSNANRSR